MQPVRKKFAVAINSREDDQPTKLPHKFSTPAKNTSLGQQRVQFYMAAINGGGDPVTALGVRGLAPQASKSRRTYQVLRDLTDTLTLLEEESNKSKA
ncbi:hypothetical protein F4859DRAFT_144185 [Xylaria cf. heliscus]|nr:hypothetical protein F4859DRAFT_144185 [Xylaria cf. heliscus]